MLGIPSRFKKPRLTIKGKILNILIKIILIVVAILIVYLCIDSTVERDYIGDNTQYEFNDSYKVSFNNLLSDVSQGNMTGIPTYDDMGVSYGETIEITKGVGDFAEIAQSDITSFKSYTMYNMHGIWVSPDTNQHDFMYSTDVIKSSTLYEYSGVTKLYDRYAWVALGTYWADKFGIDPEDTWKTYRVCLDSGSTFDVICTDVKSNGDPLSINEPSGTFSIGHRNNSSSNSVSVVEFELMDFDKNYPIKSARGNLPELNYGSMLQFKTDVSHNVKVKLMGDVNFVPEYKGNVISIQTIDDPKIKDIRLKAEEEKRQRVAASANS